MRVTTANIKCNPTMRQAFVESDIRHVAAIQGIIMGQEIEIPRYKTSWVLRMRKTRITSGIAQECPISIPTKVWQRVGDVEIRLMHKGKAHVSPNRYVTVQKATRRADGLKVAFMNTHMVSAAFSKRIVLGKAWRREMWSVHWKAMMAWVVELLAEGWTVVLGGDFNKTKLPLPHNALELASHGLDHLVIFPAPRVRVGPVKVTALTSAQGMHTDHPILTAQFALTPPRA